TPRSRRVDSANRGPRAYDPPIPPRTGGITVARRILLVYLKDTFFAADARLGATAANWHYNGADYEDVRVKMLNSGALMWFKLDAENGQPQAHLNGELARIIAVFPPGGWSGYAWEELEQSTEEAAQDVATRRKLAASGIVVPGR